MRKTVIIIPALSPDRRLLDLIIELQSESFDKIIVIDDGSGIRYQNIFEQAKTLGCILVTHDKNYGKGAALKSGIQESVKAYGRGHGIITVDADGQHKVSDILKVADAMDKNPGKLILGTRDFSGENVPKRSRFGNRITSGIFGLVSGKKCPDTQTGLRGIPDELIILALTEEGRRYEYEMNFLSDAAEKTDLVFVPIETVYENNNETSHFRPVRDSLLIYGRFVRFLLSSVSGSIIDYFVFAFALILIPLLGGIYGTGLIVFATVTARLASGTVNFIMNKVFAFQSRGNTFAEGVRYLILFMVQMALSAGGVSILSMVIPVIWAKVVVDTTLFFISFVVQKRWVFRKKSVESKRLLEKTGIESYGKGALYE
ncbi:MAG: bifunctional glycosyltransferase family 2/GtrA family protein [Lachnospiraceae bacterium]|nr:bifunctional glycosyltransferase family 2/GtrA family protein [Lachnospiraceae bacterium]